MLLNTDLDRRKELGRFLKARRLALVQDDALPPKHARRRQGRLRQEDVAVLAGMSVAWYQFLEQGRNVNVSVPMLESIARVLNLSPAGTTYVHMLANQLPPPRPPVGDGLVPRVQMLVDQQEPLPAYAVDRAFDLICWNSAAARAMGDFAALPPKSRNIAWLLFVDPRARELIVDWDARARGLVAEIRMRWARFGLDPSVTGLVERLLHSSADFSRWWSLQEIDAPVTGPRVWQHPTAGRLELELTLVQLRDAPDISVAIYTPAAGSDALERLRKLSEPPVRRRL